MRYLLFHPRQVSVINDNCYHSVRFWRPHTDHTAIIIAWELEARACKVCDCSRPCRDQMEQDLTRLRAEVADNKKGQTATQDSLQQVKQQERTLSTDLKTATQSLAAAVQAKDRLEREVRVCRGGISMSTFLTLYILPLSFCFCVLCVCVYA